MPITAKPNLVSAPENAQPRDLWGHGVEIRLAEASLPRQFDDYSSGLSSAMFGAARSRAVLPSMTMPPWRVNVEYF